MKLALIRSNNNIASFNRIQVKREKGDKRIRSERSFWTKVRDALKEADHNVILANPQKDGGLTSMDWYLRTKERVKDERSMLVFDPNYVISDIVKSYNSHGVAELHVDYDIFDEHVLDLSLRVKMNGEDKFIQVWVGEYADTWHDVGIQGEETAYDGVTHSLNIWCNDDTEDLARLKVSAYPVYKNEQHNSTDWTTWDECEILGIQGSAAHTFRRDAKGYVNKVYEKEWK